MNWPVPVGPGYTIPRLRPATISRKFDLPRTGYVVVFQPVDVNDPGTLILYDKNDVAMLTMTGGGYALFTPVPDGQTGYYFIASNGANIAAIIRPYTG